MNLDLIQKYIRKIETFVRESRFFPFAAALLASLTAAIMADRKTSLLYGLLALVFVLFLMVWHLSSMVQPIVTQNADMAVNLSSGPIIRTYEIGKVYKVQLLRAISANPDNIIGVSARDLHVLFGNSSFMRQEGSSSVWQYSNGSCVLDIFFEARGGRSPDMTPAAYYEARSTSSDKVFDKKDCVNALLKGNAGLNVGTFYRSVME